ncbi:hypothetical protein VN0636_12590 [Helicobacter pylori]
MNLIAITSLIIIDLLLLKQYNQQSNIPLSFLEDYANWCFLERYPRTAYFSFRGVI